MCGGGWCLSGAGFLFCFSVSVACCRLGGGCGCCLFLLGLSLAFRSFNRQWRSFPRPSVSLVPFVVTRSAWFLTGRVLFSLTCSQGVCLSASPTVFPLIKRRSDANSILFVIRSGSFVPSYLNSFFLQCQSHRCLSFSLTARLSHSPAAVALSNVSLLLACSTPLTAAEREVKCAVWLLRGCGCAHNVLISQFFFLQTLCLSIKKRLAES